VGVLDNPSPSLQELVSMLSWFLLGGDESRLGWKEEGDWEGAGDVLREEDGVRRKESELGFNGEDTVLNGTDEYG